MPIEIRELVIKASVNNNQEKPTASSGAAESMEAGVQEALEQISDMKRKENER